MLKCAMDRPLALITGAAKRVGKAIAIQLARRGYDIVFTYQSSSEPSAALVADLKALGADARAVHADLTNPAGVRTVIHEVSAFRPWLNAIINNASIYKPDSDDPEEAARIWQIHFHAPLLLARGLASRLKTAHGCIVNMCDILGDRPMPGWLAYCGSKAALANLTLGLARELAPDARCCGIAPGVVDWPSDFSDEQKAKYLQRVPLQRAGAPDDVARLVYYLLHEGTYITGQIIALDGGRSIT